MKTFLVPVDFTDNALRALEYALDLATEGGANHVVVLHAYDGRAVVPGFSDTIRHESQVEAEQKMKRFLDKVSARQVALDVVIREGSPASVISRAIESYGVSLVVMGTGGGKSLMKRVLGTTAEAVSRLGLCPVLTIPENAVIKPIEHIVYAADFENGDQVTALQLLQLKELFGATLTFLHIKSESQPDYIDDEYIKESLVKQFPSANINFVEIKNKDVAEGISTYVSANNTSLLAFTILNRNLLEKVLHSSVTHKLLQKLYIPMLALPENGTLLELKQQERAERE